jgi:hypothetical protein
MGHLFLVMKQDSFLKALFHLCYFIERYYSEVGIDEQFYLRRFLSVLPLKIPLSKPVFTYFFAYSSRLPPTTDQ